MVIMHAIIRWFEQQSRESIIASVLLLIMCVGICDYMMDGTVELLLMYAVPVCLAAWTHSYWGGIIASVAAMLGWVSAGFFAEAHPAHPWLWWWNMATRLGLLLLMVYVVASLRAARRDAHQSGQRDPLTGLANHREFFMAGQREVERCVRYKHPLTMVYFDVDHLGYINERFGHAVGDALLCLAARTIEHQTRNNDMVARIDGDAFAILMPDTSDAVALQVIGRLQNQLLHTMRHEDYPVTFSVGAATFFSPPSTYDQLIQQAVRLVDIAKRSGTGQIKHASFGGT